MVRGLDKSSMIPVQRLDIGSENSPREALTCPFPALTVDLTDEELRESAFEVFLAAHRPTSMEDAKMPSFLGKQIVSPSKSSRSARSRSHRRSWASFAMGCFKTASPAGSNIRVPETKSTMTEVDVMRTQMDITEKAAARACQALAKENDKVGGKFAVLFLPLALLLNTSSSGFSTCIEHEQWKRRQLKILEAEMHAHPAFKAVNTIDLLNKLPQAIQSDCIKSSKIGTNAETLNGKSAKLLKDLLNVCMEVRWEAFQYPLNIHLYKMLLMSLFDSLDESAFAENCNEIMALIKETWNLLGIEQVLHSVCIMWISFQQFVLTGGTEVNLLMATEKAVKDLVLPSMDFETLRYRDFLQSVLNSILRWLEPSLLDYWGAFSTRNSEVMKIFLHLTVLGRQILHKLENSVEMQSDTTEGNRLETYVQSSLQSVFWKICKVNDKSLEATPEQSSILVDLAKSVEDVASEEQQRFSPLLKLWLPNAASVAARTLHKCYGMELKRYLASTTTLNLDAVKVLQSAAKLERAMLKMIMEDELQFNEPLAHHCSIVPFASDVETTAALKEWLNQRLELLLEWSTRNIKQETWTPKASKDRYASSAVELLRIIEETSDAFLKLPVSQNLELLQDFTNVLDEAVDKYVNLVLVGCGNKEDYTQNFFLSRCKDLSISIFSKLNRSWRGTFETLITHDARVWPEVNEENLTHNEGPINLQYLCVRMNTLHKIFSELEFLEKKVRYAWQELAPDPFMGATSDLIIAHGKFERSGASCQANLNKLYEIAAYKVVFGDLKGVFWESLYLNGASHSRIEPVLEQLNLQLEIIAEVVSDQLRNHVVNHLMMACYDCFLQIVSKENTTLGEDDVLILKEDLTALKELFISNGEGLPENLVEEAAEPVDQFLSLLAAKAKDSQYQGGNIETSISGIMNYRTAGVAGLHQRSSSSASLSSVLGHTCHIMASNLVMRTYSFARR